MTSGDVSPGRGGQVIKRKKAFLQVRNDCTIFDFPSKDCRLGAQLWFTGHLGEGGWELLSVEGTTFVFIIKSYVVRLNRLLRGSVRLHGCRGLCATRSRLDGCRLRE